MGKSNVFDLLGPIMVGPSSSHTAGAVRLGAMTRKILGEEPSGGTIVLHGSFATTGKGPIDEVIEAMGEIGKQMPCTLKETAQGGLAMTPMERQIQADLL